MDRGVELPEMGGRQEMTADERRRRAISEYFRAYGEYKELDEVRHHICVEMSGDTLIEIRRLYSGMEGNFVLRVKRKEEDCEGVSAETTAYEWAAGCLKDMIRERLEDQAAADARETA